MIWNTRSIIQPTKFLNAEDEFFFFELIAPWWEDAKTNPEIIFLNTFVALKNVPSDLQQTKRSQIITGIEAGHKEIVKMHRMLLFSPLIYLAIIYKKRGHLVL
mmetsp:Transcript_56558/g.66105  ORF Transcript_56558/g.66105 Transcript_56558/m.66105 type:complete len:103 (+) Transcript_56558:198-506(+)